MSLTLPSKWLVTDSNGAPIVGAAVYIYEPGTTTKKTIFSDSGLTGGKEILNPMITDADGRTPSSYSAQPFKIVVLTDTVENDGLPVWDDDDVTSVAVPLATTTDAGIVEKATAAEVASGAPDKYADMETLLANLQLDTSATISGIFTEGRVAQATETLRGSAEIATQAEVDAETDDTRIVTTLKMATYVAAQILGGSVEDIRLGALYLTGTTPQDTTAWLGQDTSPFRQTGGVSTDTHKLGGGDDPSDILEYRPIQKRVGGNWVTVTDV